MSKDIIKIKKHDLVFAILAVFFLGLIFGSFFYTKTVEKEIVRYTTPELPRIDGERTISMLVPAVDAEGSGIAGELITTVRPASGYGMILVSVNDALAQYDTQLSGKMAAKAAENYTGISLDSLEIIYRIRVNASVIEGPSAGAAMAVSIIAALEDKRLNPDVMITGTIDENGNIGPAGAIEEKIKAAKTSNVSIFLVSPGLEIQYETKKTKECETIKGVEHCEVVYIEERRNIGESLGMRVEEVGTIKDALKYFLIG